MVDKAWRNCHGLSFSVPYSWCSWCLPLPCVICCSPVCSFSLSLTVCVGLWVTPHSLLSGPLTQLQHVHPLCTLHASLDLFQCGKSTARFLSMFSASYQSALQPSFPLHHKPWISCNPHLIIFSINCCKLSLFESCLCIYNLTRVPFQGRKCDAAPHSSP